MYTTDFAHDGPIFLVPLSPSYPSSHVAVMAVVVVVVVVVAVAVAVAVMAVVVVVAIRLFAVSILQKSYNILTENHDK